MSESSSRLHLRMKQREAVIHSEVVEDRTRPATAIRAISTCSRPASGPRRRKNQCRQPPMRRATSATPESESTSMAAAPAAMAMRPEGILTCPRVPLQLAVRKRAASDGKRPRL
jgi:hypothetical protein